MEEWKTIKDYPDYEVSSLGRVRSLKTGKGARAVDGILKGGKDGSGYPIVSLCEINKKQKSWKVHRLVAEAFLPNPEAKKEIDHINRIRDDNRVENLRWATRKENNLNTSRQQKEYHNISFRVRVVREEGIFDKTFLTLEKAIQARDAILTTLDQSYTAESSRSDYQEG